MFNGITFRGEYRMSIPHLVRETLTAVFRRDQICVASAITRT